MKLKLGLKGGSVLMKGDTGRCPYPTSLAQIRKKEYPSLQATTYLDHAGTTPPPQSAINAFAKDMNSHLFGNPHSASPSSMLSTERIESVRRQMLAFFKADPEDYDLVFVANATAAVKLVVESVAGYSLAQNPDGNGKTFWYGYHRDCHTSLIGPREVTSTSRYFGEDAEVERWLSSPRVGDEVPVGIFAYPAQSNMNGRRLPLNWPGRLRKSRHQAHRNVYSLLDAAAFVATAQLDLSDAANAPDFTALSFYKIFGFPDLGALIVRKEVGHVLSKRQYLGGGTVDMIVNDHDPLKDWHARKQTSLHEMLEDGTPPFHSIISLECALEVHRRLYGSMMNVSSHTSRLVRSLYEAMAGLKYTNGQVVCKIYKDPSSTYGNSRTQGPTISFNIQDRNGHWIGKTEFERAAITANIQLRTGGVCNPGGVASALDLSPAEMKANYVEGVRCGNDVDEMHGKPTGIVRVSLGAMSNAEDVKKFLVFLNSFVEAEDMRTHSLDTPRYRPSGNAHPVPRAPQDSSEKPRFDFEMRSAFGITARSAKVNSRISVAVQQIMDHPKMNGTTRNERRPEQRALLNSSMNVSTWTRLCGGVPRAKHPSRDCDKQSGLGPT